MIRKNLPRFAVFVCSFLIVCGALAQSIADLTSQANAAQSLGNYDEAINTWNALLAKDPKNGGGYRSRGACYFHKDDFEKAMADFSQAIALNTNDAAAYSGRGDCHYKKGDWTFAIINFNRAIQLSPRSVPFYRHIIGVYWAEYDWDNVITNVTKLIQLNPEDDARAHDTRAWAFNTRGLAWQFKTNLDRALDDFTSAIQLSQTRDAPARAQALADRAEVRIMKEDLQGALDDLNEAIRLNPTNTAFLQARASVYQPHKKKFDRIAYYSKAIELDTQGSLACDYCQRGYAYQTKNLLDNAIADFTTYIQMMPTDGAGYIIRAHAYFESGKYKEARSDLDECIRLNPTNSSGYLELARYLATCPDASFRNGKEALELAKKGRALETNQDDVDSALAVASAEAGDFDEAVRNQNQTISYLKRISETPGTGVPAKEMALEKEKLQLFEQHKPYHGVVKMSDLDD